MKKLLCKIKELLIPKYIDEQKKLLVPKYTSEQKKPFEELLSRATSRMKEKPICPICKTQMKFRQSSIGGMGELKMAPIRDDQAWKCPKCFYLAGFGIPITRKEATTEIYLRGSPYLSMPRINPVEQTMEVKRRLRALGYLEFKGDE